MKALLGAALVALILVLGVIAFDLHQVARTLGVVTGVGPYAVHTTRDQRVKAAAKSADDAMDELEAIIKAPRETNPKVPPRR